MADKWSALGLGRPSYINDDNWNVPMVTENDIPRESFDGRALPRSSALMFIAMSVLTTMLSEILSKFYSIKSMRTSESTTQMMTAFNDLLERLEGFKQKYLLPLDSFEDQIPNPTGKFISTIMM